MMCPNEQRPGAATRTVRAAGGENHDLARRDAICDRTADEHERRPGNGLHHHDPAEDRAGAGQLQNEPGESHEEELVAAP